MTDSKPNPFMSSVPEKTDSIEYEGDAKKSSPDVHSVSDLTGLDTGDIPALKDKADAVQLRAEKYIIKESEGLRTLCDAIDAAMSRDDIMEGFNLDAVRGYVKTVMVTLKAKPEFDGILLDKDVSNLVQFATRAYHQAETIRQMESGAKAAKAAKRKTKESGSKAKIAAIASKVEFKL